MTFCRNCGAKSDEVGRFCHECGTRRGEGNAYCYHCGEAGGDNNAAKICTLCNKKAPSGIPDPVAPKRPERAERAPLQRKRSNSGSVLEAALKVAKTPSSDTEITVEWLAKATGENNVSQVSSWHQILATERITSINILKRTIDSPYWTNLVLPIGVKVQIETFVKSPRSDTEEAEETIGELASPKSRPSAMNGLKPKSKTLRQVRGEISSAEQNDQVPEINISPAAPMPKGGKPLPPVPPRKERKPLAVTIPSTTLSSPASPVSGRSDLSPIESPRSNKSGPSSPRAVAFAEPSYSPRSHVIVVESNSPREEKNGSISPRRGDSSPRDINSSTPRAPPPITAESLKPSKSDATVVPPPRPPRRLVRTNSEGASTKSKIEPPPVRRRESDAPKMQTIVSVNNNNINNNDIGPVSEPEVKLVKSTFGTAGKAKTLREKALNLEIEKPVAKSTVGDSINRILADVTGHSESNQFKAYVSHWEEKPKALDSKKTVTMMSIIVSNGSEHWSVFRRYGQFEKLDSGLKKKGVMPHGDNTLKMLGKPSDPALLRDVLNRYLMYILGSPTIQAHHYLHNFLMPVQIGDVKPTQINQKKEEK